MTSTRDSQRQRVYDAEHQMQRMLDRSADYPTAEIAGSTIVLPSERKFASIESIQTYVDAVLALNWVRETWPRATVPVKVRQRAGQAMAHYEWRTATIAIPAHVGGSAWAMREMVVLHELAHHLGEPGHGPEFTSRIIALVTENHRRGSRFRLAGHVRWHRGEGWVRVGAYGI